MIWDRATVEKELRHVRGLCLFFAGLLVLLSLGYLWINWMSMQVARDIEVLRAAGRRTDELDHTSTAYAYFTAASTITSFVAVFAFVLLLLKGSVQRRMGLIMLVVTGTLHGVVQGWARRDLVDAFAWPILVTILAAMWWFLQLKLRRVND